MTKSDKKIQQLSDEVAALKAKLASYPADWSVDCSLETWFPATAAQLREQTNSLTIQEVCEYLDVNRKQWPTLMERGVVFKTNDTPDLKRSVIGYIRYVRDHSSAETKDLKTRKLEAETSLAERKDAEAAGELVPATEYETNFTEAVTKICLAVSRLKSLNDAQRQEVIEAMQKVELPPLEFAKEEIEA